MYFISQRKTDVPAFYVVFFKGSGTLKTSYYSTKAPWTISTPTSMGNCLFPQNYHHNQEWGAVWVGVGCIEKPDTCVMWRVGSERDQRGLILLGGGRIKVPQVLGEQGEQRDHRSLMPLYAPVLDGVRKTLEKPDIRKRKELDKPHATGWQVEKGTKETYCLLCERRKGSDKPYAWGIRG
ncbi:hypothetical protein FKM82_000797 [Ascaphus truei]